MSESQQNKHASIVVVHYGQADPFGGEQERRKVNHPEKHLLEEAGVDPETITRSKLIRTCIDSIQKNTADYPAELIVIDNGGDPDDSDYLLNKARQGVINTYVRNRDNMNFGWAFNQGVALATGDHICLTCNDHYFRPTWLSTCVSLLDTYEDQKLIATPLLTPDKDFDKFRLGTLDGYRLNSLAGSSCMVLRRSDLAELGPFSTYRIAGTQFARNALDLGYKVIIPPENLAIHTGMMGGTDFNKEFRVGKELLDGSKIDYTYVKKQ
jgi:glycosyltransferase involved in cell wall biosynthesis